MMEFIVYMEVCGHWEPHFNTAAPSTNEEAAVLLFTVQRCFSSKNTPAIFFFVSQKAGLSPPSATT